MVKNVYKAQVAKAAKQRYRIGLVMLLFFVTLYSSCDELENEDNTYKEIELENTDTTKSHILIFVGGKTYSKVLIIDKKEILNSSSFNEHGGRDFSTDLEKIRVIIFNSRYSIDTVLKLSNYKKYILIAKLDSTILIQDTNNAKQINIR